MSNNPWEDFLRGMMGFGTQGPTREAWGGVHVSNPDDASDGDAGGAGAGSGGGVGLHPRIGGKPHSKRWKVGMAILLIVIIGFCYWWFHPAINIQSSGLWWFLAIFVALPAFATFRALYRRHEGDSDINVDDQRKATRYRHLSWIPVAFVVAGIVAAFGSSTFFPYNAGKYAQVLQTTEYDFASDIPEVDYSQIPVIDYASAQVLGNRAMGSIPDYVSQFEISDLYTQINYQDQPVRVSPLGYADFFKWITNRTPGIPAYVMVNMTTQDTQVVRLENAMKYTQSEPFVRNINRYVQLKYPFYMFETLSFEIDDSGHPYWICPVQKRTIGLFGGETIARVVIVDACSGETQDMDVADVPEWVDRVYPSDLLVQQYNWSGRYINGWWNSWIGQEGVRQTTPGTDGQLGYNYIAKDDDVWLYTGVTSATADNSIIGFVLIDQRTADSHYYTVAGATEDSAMASAEGQVQHLKYTATFPLLINVADQPTYFMALKDDAGLVKMYAMIDIRRYQNVATGDTVEQCQSNYEALLATNGVLSPEDVRGGTEETSGTVSAIAQAVIGGNSHFYLMLDGDDAIYDCALPDLLQVVTVHTGDTVSLSYLTNESDQGARTVTSLTLPNGQTITSTDGGSSSGASDGPDGSDVSGASDSGTSGADAASDASGTAEAGDSGGNGNGGGVSVTTAS